MMFLANLCRYGRAERDSDLVALWRFANRKKGELVCRHSIQSNLETHFDCTSRTRRNPLSEFHPVPSVACVHVRRLARRARDHQHERTDGSPRQRVPTRRPKGERLGSVDREIDDDHHPGVHTVGEGIEAVESGLSERVQPRQFPATTTFATSNLTRRRLKKF